MQKHLGEPQRVCHSNNKKNYTHTTIILGDIAIFLKRAHLINSPYGTRKMTKISIFWGFHGAHICTARAKNTILGLPEVRISAEWGLSVNARKFTHGAEVSNIWKFWCCNANIRQKSGAESSWNFGSGAWSRAPQCSTGVAPSSMKTWFSKSLEKIHYLTTLVWLCHSPSLRCGVIPNFFMLTAHKFKKISR